jgi:hypothetical protein
MVKEPGQRAAEKYGTDREAKLTILTDYRGTFYSSVSNARTVCTMDVERLVRRFAEMGVTAKTCAFPDVDLEAPWHGQHVLYQSSEDLDLRYRSYIEDVVLALSLAGANAIPRFEYLRAHHNKAFMEFLREVRQLDGDARLRARVFGTFEDFASRQVEYPAVFKAGAGAGSKGVRLAANPAEGMAAARALSSSGQAGLAAAKEWLRRLTRRGYRPYSLRRNKFVVQNFVAGLDHDFKILVYGDRVYVVRRGVRPNDFRASGSGRFTWPDVPPHGLLDFAWEVFSRLGVPAASLDVAPGAVGFRLLEVQAVCFGPVTLERSTHHWRRIGAGWERVEGVSELEATYARAVVEFLDRELGDQPASGQRASPTA